MSFQAWLAAIFVAAITGCGFGWKWRGDLAQAELLAATQQARETERGWAARYADLEKTNAKSRDDIQRRLDAALGELRKRPQRMPEAAAAKCQGASGRELSGPDAGFLEREAAHADRLQAALARCYAEQDALQLGVP